MIPVLPPKSRRDPRNQKYIASLGSNAVYLYGTSPANARQVAIEHFQPKKSQLAELTVEPVNGRR